MDRCRARPKGDRGESDPGEIAAADFREACGGAAEQLDTSDAGLGKTEAHGVSFAEPMLVGSRRGGSDVEFPWFSSLHDRGRSQCLFMVWARDRRCWQGQGTQAQRVRGQGRTGNHQPTTQMGPVRAVGQPFLVTGRGSAGPQRPGPPASVMPPSGVRSQRDSKEFIGRSASRQGGAISSAYPPATPLLHEPPSAIRIGRTKLLQRPSLRRDQRQRLNDGLAGAALVGVAEQQ
jgi:hypothetical protein